MCFFIDKIDSHKTVSESVAGLMLFLNGVDMKEEQAAHFHRGGKIKNAYSGFVW